MSFSRCCHRVGERQNEGAAHAPARQYVGWIMQPEAKPGRFEDGLDAAKNRFAGILTDLDLDTPKELAQ